MSKETGWVIETLSTQKSPGPRGPTGDFYQTYRALTLTLLRLFQKIKKKRREHSQTRPVRPASPWYRRQIRALAENYRPILQKWMQKFSTKYEHAKCKSTLTGSCDRAPRSSGVYPWDARAVHPTQMEAIRHGNRTKDTNPMTVSTGAETASDKTASWGGSP